MKPLHSFCCCVVALLVCVASACGAQGAADEQSERLHVERLVKGFVAITISQQV